MIESRRYDTDIDYCPSCKGVWLDRGKVDKITRMQHRYEEEHFHRYHRDDRDFYNDYYSRRGRGRRGFLGDLFDFD
jgi:uncharacterized protein